MKRNHYRIYLYNKYETPFCKEMASIAANTNADTHTLPIDKIYNIAESTRANNQLNNTSIVFDEVLHTLTFYVKDDFGNVNTALVLMQVQLIEIANPVNEE